MPAAGWLRPALAMVAAVTVSRLVLLALNRTDLFVDEAQYWLWGQTLDWGYYSKPPLIAWVIRAVTDLAGSDAAFWIRAPGAVLHGVTALLVAAAAIQLFGRAAGLTAALGWVTLPMVSVGSLLFTTDSVMLPFLALSLLAWIRVVRGASGPGWPAVAGLALGLAILAKYAGVYGLAGYALAALVAPGWRAPWQAWAVMIGVAALIVSPNLWWNATHDMTTFAHTADNTGWLRAGIAGLRPGAALEFVLSQAAVVGPVVAAAFVWRALRPAGGDRAALALMAALPLAAVTVQALLGGANANWAVAGWLPGGILALAALASRPGLRTLSLAINGAVALALPVLTIFPQTALGDRPLLARYIGQSALSREAIQRARGSGALAILADRRDVLADLFHTGRDAGLVIHAPRPDGRRPDHFYEQVHPLPADPPRPLLLVAREAPACARDLGAHDAGTGAYAWQGLRFWLIEEGCDVAHR